MEQRRREAGDRAELMVSDSDNPKTVCTGSEVGVSIGKVAYAESAGSRPRNWRASPFRVLLELGTDPHGEGQVRLERTPADTLENLEAMPVLLKGEEKAWSAERGSQRD